MNPLASRQVHLDFHTSEAIPDVGAKFRREDFRKALTTGRLNSMTVFAKCHHGWCYYPTKVGLPHPTLRRDLAGEMIAAAHEIGVRAPIYVTVGWSAADAQRHPEWVARRKSGEPAAINTDPAAPPDAPRPFTSWTFLCPGTGYGDHVVALTEELCERYPVDGIFYDITFRPLCYCPSCLTQMESEGTDPADEPAVAAFTARKWARFAERCRAALFARHPEATVFFNGGAQIEHPERERFLTHFELEDLPTTWGGYDKFPLRAKFFARFGKPYLAMSGKFHTSWGEFGGFKSRAAVRYECAAMLAFGARCSFGDQMHPSGRMDLETYRLIGHGYRYVEKIERWCFDAQETTRLGLFIANDARSREGAAKALMERQLDFDVALADDDFSRFDALVLPDDVALDEALAARLNAFAAKGGGILATGASGMDAGRTRFLLDIGATAVGPGRCENDFVHVGPELGKGLVRSPVLCYRPAHRVAPTDGEVLAAIHEPYFDRTYAHYCSHRNTPFRPRKAAHPGAVRRGSVVYLAHPIFRIYQEFGAQFHRDYALNALRLIYRDPVMQVALPSAGRARFVRLPGRNAYALHLLYASPIQRGGALVIEDLPPIRNVQAVLRVDEPVKRVTLEPQGRDVRFEQREGRVRLAVPRVACHQLVILQI